MEQSGPTSRALLWFPLDAPRIDQCRGKVITGQAVLGSMPYARRPPRKRGAIRMQPWNSLQRQTRHF